MQIYLASDHAGFYLKEKIKEYLKEKGYIVKDFGANNFDGQDDYPNFILPCVKEYIRETNGDAKRGVVIIFGGTGTGEAIVANKVRSGKAVVYNGNSMEIVKLAREHNNANILSIGARFVEEENAKEAIRIFLSTPFEAGRHAKRVLMLDMI